MHSNQRNPSYTLPRNFTFHFNDTNSSKPAQKLPVHEPSSSIGPYRLRRRREPRKEIPQTFAHPDADVAIPTIEVFSPLSTRQHEQNLAASASAKITLKWSPPRTPVPQTSQLADGDSMVTDTTETASQADSISRPSTACSGFSDSSDSSSVESFPSIGGSFASPECDRSAQATAFVTLDSVVADSAAVHQVRRMLPTTATSSPTKPSWTDEMDSHLWTTYMKYLQDPRHTPFKMLPGTAPPLGVCSRVAREAKRSWKGQRARTVARVSGLRPRDNTAQADSPDTIRPSHSGSVTPTEKRASHYETVWPRSDAATRRRLRELCKCKPSLAAHYHRLLSTRSPSPFTDSPGILSNASIDESMRSTASLAVPREPPITAFSTRDMSLSLFSSTSLAVTAMNQLTAESTDASATNSSPPHALPPPPPVPTQSQPTVMRHGGHQKSRSLHSNIYPGSSYRSRDGLASPFQPRRPTTTLRKNVREAFQTPIASNLRLASPLQVAAPRQRSRQSLRHLFMQDDSNDLDQLSRRPFPDLDTRTAALAGRRARSRAVSMGDVSASSRRLSLLFEPPSGHGMIAVPTATASIGPSASTVTNLPQVPQLPDVRRLGSPFAEKPARPVFNTFPRNFSFHGLEPALEISEDREVLQEPNANTASYELLIE